MLVPSSSPTARLIDAIGELYRGVLASDLIELPRSRSLASRSAAQQLALGPPEELAG